MKEQTNIGDIKLALASILSAYITIRGIKSFLAKDHSKYRSRLRKRILLSNEYTGDIDEYIDAQMAEYTDYLKDELKNEEDYLENNPYYILLGRDKESFDNLAIQKELKINWHSDLDTLSTGALDLINKIEENQ